MSSGTGWFSVFTIGKGACPKNEALVYLANYRNLYGSINGADLFEGEYDTEHLISNLKDAALSHLTQVYAMNQYAAQKEITLDQQELDRVEQAAKKYYDSLSKKEKSALKVKETDIRDMYGRLALAEKVYTDLMGSVDEEVSEDEARVVDAKIIVISDQDKADTVQNLINSGTEFDLLNSYNDATQMDVSLKRGEYPIEVEEALFSLEDGAVAGPIAASDGKYYFVKCISKYNQELSEENKKSIVEKRQTNRVGDILDDLDENVYSELNQKLWNEIELPDKETVKTNSFFSVLHEYLSY